MFGQTVLELGASADARTVYVRLNATLAPTR